MAKRDSPDPEPPLTRPHSVWPESERAGGAARSTQFDTSRFDPLHDQVRRDRERLASPFDLCKPALALRVLLFLQLVVALTALPASEALLDWAYRSFGLAFAALAAGLVWLPMVCALRVALLRMQALARSFAIAALGALSATLGWAMIALIGLAPSTGFAALAAAASGASLATLVWAWLGLRARAAQPVEAAARLAELQARIRPHFLFNALNTALALVRVDPERAEAVLEDLSQLFRAALAETGAAVSLDEEIELAQRYLAVEKLRFGSRLQVMWDLDPAAGAARVPPLVLQPLVENAVRHGIEPALGGGRIQVRTQRRRGMVEVLVSNTLPEEPGPPGSGIAQANVRERLRLLHDVAATLEVGVVQGLYQARLVVPM